MYCKKLSVFIVFLWFIVSCTSNIDEQVTLLKQTSINLPLDKMELVVSPVKQDSIDHNADLYFIVWENASSCNTCAINHIGIWYTIIKKVNEKANVGFRFIFSPNEKKIETIKHLYYKQHFPNNIFIDKSKEFEKANPIFEKVNSHYLLIDKAGKVLYVGNPTKNENASEMLIKTIDYWVEHHQK